MHRLLPLLFFVFVWLPASAQVGTQFWFAPPKIAAVFQGGQYHNQPIRLVVYTMNQPAQVQIEMPANPAFNPLRFTLAPNEVRKVELTPFINLVEPAATPVISSNGLLIRSTAAISAYYVVDNHITKEAFALKGPTALGKAFMVPSQSVYPGPPTTPEPRNNLNIVASEDSTTITIQPNGRGYEGNASAQVRKALLRRGQTYNIRSLTRQSYLGGIEVLADKPVAVTLAEDNVLVNPCADLSGDQLLPNSKAGTSFIVPNTGTGTTNEVWGAVLDHPTNYSITTNTGTQNFTSTGRGAVINFKSNSPFIVVNSNKPILLMHYTTYGCELGSAVMPHAGCSGSKEANVYVEDTTLVTIVTDLATASTFKVNNLTNFITPADFSPVPGTGKYYAIKALNGRRFPQNKVVNIQADGLFQLGYLAGAQMVTAKYGFFSGFNTPGVQDELTLCNNDFPTTISALSQGAKYQWTTGDTGRTATISAPGTYYVNITTAGCVGRDTIVVKGLQVPTIAPFDSTICTPAATVTLIKRGLRLYNQLNDTVPAIKGDTLRFNHVGARTWYAEYANDICKSSRALFTLRLGSNLSSPLTAKSLSVCSNSASLLAAPNSNSDLRTRWNTRAFLNDSLRQDALFTAPKVQRDTTILRILQTTSISTGCSRLDTVSILVRAQPVASTRFSGPSQICSGQPVALVVRGMATRVFTYNLNGAVLANSTSQTQGDTAIITLNLQFPQPRDYKITVRETTAQNCVADSNSFDIRINSRPNLPALPQYTTCAGQPVSLGVPRANFPQYKWQPATWLSDDTNDVVSFNYTQPLTKDSSFVIWQRITDRVTGCADSQQVNVLVRVLPQPLVANDTTLCAGTTAVIGNPVINHNMRIRWTSKAFLDDSLKQDALFTAPRFPRDTVVKKVMQVTNTLTNCFRYDTVEIAVRAQPTASTRLSGPSETCEGQPLTLSITALAGRQYSYNLDGATLTGINQLVVGDSVKLALNLQFAAVRDYRITFREQTPQGCVADSNTFTIRIHPKPSMAQLPAYATCPGRSVDLGIRRGTSPIYKWSPATWLNVDNQEVVSFTYPQEVQRDSVFTLWQTIINQATGCRDSQQVRVTVQALPRYQAIADTTVCPQQAVTLASPFSPAIYSFRWSPGRLVSDSNRADASFIAPPLSRDSSYKFILTVTNGIGCLSYDTVTVTVPASVIPQMAFAPDSIICAGTDVRLLPLSPMHNSIKWFRINANGSRTLLGSGGPLDLPYSQLGPQPWLFELETSTNGRCPVTSRRELKLAPAPQPAIGPNPGLCPGVESYVYIASGEQGSTFNWRATGGSILSQRDSLVQVAWLPQGPYELAVKERGSYPFCESEWITLNVERHPQPGDPASGCDPALFPLKVPNVITPNGDGYNQRLVIENLELYAPATLTITNRWGQQVYHTDRYLNDWEAKDLPSAVYFYHLTVGSQQFKGWVQVVK